VSFVPKGASERGEKWAQLAKTHTPHRSQLPSLTERLNKLPPAIGVTAALITGLVLFAAAFYLTNLITG
jgi:hypothetical protein